MRARDNPFRSDCIEAVPYRLHGRTWGDLMLRLRSLGWRGAVVGPEGSGKTTLLEELGRRLRQEGYHIRTVRFDGRAGRSSGHPTTGISASLRAGDFVLVDGADALGGLAWLRLKRLARQAGGLVVTSHRPGLLPTLHECSTDAGLLEEIVVELTGDAGVALREAACDLFTRHRGNLRDALRSLYEMHAAMPN
jgi:hypothetical protein